MTRYYHARFFADTRFTAVGVIALLLLGFWGVELAFLLIPIVSLIGANQTAFDASYLFMARRYAAALEREINGAMRRKVLIGADLEDRYLVPLDTRSVVGVAFGAHFSWFGWMTIFYTALGVAAYAGGLWLGLAAVSGTARIVYLLVLGVLTVSSLVIGWWWFVLGAGRDRLDEIVEEHFEGLV